MFQVDTISNRVISLYLSRNCRSHIRRQLMLFSTGLGWSVSGSLGQTWNAAGLICRLWTWHSSAKRTRKKKGRWGLRPWPFQCLSQFFLERKDGPLRERMCCVCLRTFHRWGGLVFIVSVFPVRWWLGFFPIG